MIIDCQISSNNSELLNCMKETLEEIFGVKLVDVTKSTHTCKCGKHCCKKTEFDNVKEIEHIN